MTHWSIKLIKTTNWWFYFFLSTLGDHQAHFNRTFNFFKVECFTCIRDTSHPILQRCGDNEWFTIIAYQYLWSCDMAVGDPNRALPVSCKRPRGKRTQNEPRTCSPLLIFTAFPRFQDLFHFGEALVYVGYCDVFSLTLSSVFLPPCLQLWTQCKLGGKGWNRSSQGCRRRNSGRWMPHFFRWLAHPSNPVANVGTYSRAKYVHPLWRASVYIQVIFYGLNYAPSEDLKLVWTNLLFNHHLSGPVSLLNKTQSCRFITWSLVGQVLA